MPCIWDFSIACRQEFLEREMYDTSCIERIYLNVKLHYLVERPRNEISYYTT